MYHYALYINIYHRIACRKIPQQQQLSCSFWKSSTLVISSTCQMRAGEDVTQKGRCGRSQRRRYDYVSIDRSTGKQNNMQMEKTVSSNSLQKNLTGLGRQKWISSCRGSCNMSTLHQTRVSRPSWEAISIRLIFFFLSKTKNTLLGNVDLCLSGEN